MPDFIIAFNKFSYYIAPYAFMAACILTYYRLRSGWSLLAVVGGLICIVGMTSRYTLHSVTVAGPDADSDLAMIMFLGLAGTGWLIGSVGIAVSLLRSGSAPNQSLKSRTPEGAA